MPDVLVNRLAGETSPYLLQHAANPVAWQAWDAAALTTARRENRPILLSIGYSACHWCHVMAHESFEDAEVAAVMNQLFVNIKVDREERPDLDQIYQAAHQLLTGRAGGWPLTVFLTPDGLPFFGGTYFPKTPRYGLPGFADLCKSIENTYRRRRDDIDRQSLSLQAAMNETLPRAHGDAVPDGRAIDVARDALLQNFDGEWGGFGAAPKFPHPTDLALLLRCFARAGDAQARDAALLTLRSMGAGGIYDQIGGGFSRYSVDARWEIPHFEKMLYDNGPLLALYAEAWRITGDSFYQRVADETAAWVMREMQSPGGAYYSSLDADSEGAEGRFYVWDRAAVRALLNDDEWKAVECYWGLNRTPNFENRHWHLRVAEPATAVAPATLGAARAKLFAARESRIHPGRDDKILTAWNALMIQGMARAARIFDRPDWLVSARRARDHLRATLWNDGHLLATSRDGRAHLAAYLDDYAFLLAALIDLMQAEFCRADLDWAVELADALLARFEDAKDGGFFFTAHDHEALIHRPKPAFDNATPAGNGVAAVALQRLGYLLGEPRYIDAARRTLELFAPQIAQHAAGCATLIEALAEAIEPPAMVVLRGPVAQVCDWQHRLAREWAGVTLALPNGLSLPGGLAKPECDEVNAWVCSGVTCSAPVGDFDKLRKIIFS